MVDIHFAEGFAVSAGCVQLVLAWLLWREDHHRPEWGLRWISLSMACGSFTNIGASLMVTAVLRGERSFSMTLTEVAAVVVGFSSLGALVTGIQCYTGKPVPRAAPRFLALSVGLASLAIGTFVLGVPLAGDLTAMGVFLYCIGLCVAQARREPGVGHSFLALTLGLHPLSIITLTLAGSNPIATRYIAAVPYALTGLVLFLVSLRRLRASLAEELQARHAVERELRELNGSLEARVAQRTTELKSRNDELARLLQCMEESQRHIAESEQRIRTVMAATREGIWDWDVNAGTMINSPRWCEMFGHPPEVLERPVAEFVDLIPQDERAEVFAALDKSMEGGQPYFHEHRMRRLDGNELWVLDRGDVVSRDEKGRPLRMVGSVADITDRKRAELALAQSKAQAEATSLELTQTLHQLRLAQDELVRAEKLAALGSLVAGIAHELNTPIGNAVMVASTLAARTREFGQAVAGGLRRSTLEGYLADAAEISTVLERNLQRSAELISSFKQLAADQSSDQRREFRLLDVAQEVVIALSPTLRRSGTQVALEIDPGIGLDSFPGPLGQVLVNLINNASLHGYPDGGGRVEVFAQATGEMVGIEVRDQGLGISPENQERVFDPFFTTRLGQGGSGLGLHIVHNLVTGPLGGRVEFRSERGRGTTFYIRLPRRAPAAPAAGGPVTMASRFAFEEST